MVRGYQPTDRPRVAPPPQGGSGTAAPQMVNGTKTDALKMAVSDEIERRRKVIDASHWEGSATVAIIIRLRAGKPQRISFRTEDEVSVVERG